jgi:hypothetical protein
VTDLALGFVAGLALGFTVAFAWRRELRVFYLESRGNHARKRTPPGADTNPASAPGDDS